MPKTVDVVESVVLRAGDVLVLDTMNFQVVQGTVACTPEGYKCLTDTTTLQSVVLEEVYALHDDGKLVYEISTAFTGTWRED